MKIEDIIHQLNSLIEDRKSFLTGEDDEVFRDDIKALEEAIEIIRKDILDEKEVYKQALEEWGAEAQICMVFEEMSELQKELCKYLRNVDAIETKLKIAEEIADVEIMLEQMKILFDIHKAVERHKKIKILRLEERLNRLGGA